MLIPILAYITLEVYYSWRLFAGLCVIPCLFSLTCSVIFVPESPRWLVAKGRKDEALAILRKAAETNGIDPYVAFPRGVALADESAEHGDFAELLSVSTYCLYRICLRFENAMLNVVWRFYLLIILVPPY